MAYPAMRCIWLLILLGVGFCSAARNRKVSIVAPQPRLKVVEAICRSRVYYEIRMYRSIFHGMQRLKRLVDSEKEVYRYKPKPSDELLTNPPYYTHPIAMYNIHYNHPIGNKGFRKDTIVFDSHGEMVRMIMERARPNKNGFWETSHERCTLKLNVQVD